MPEESHAQAASKVTLIGALLDLVLGITKILTGIACQSHALVADGIHSLSDLVTDALVLIVTRYSHQKPDRQHPYGHARFETLATLLLGSSLIAVAGAMAWDSIQRLLSEQTLSVPEWPALLVAMISIAGKEWIYHYTMAVANRIQSELLKANAWHSRSDALSSVVVLIGVTGAMLGLEWLDQLSAILVAGMVAHIGWRLMMNSIRELVDTALPEAKLNNIHHQLIRTDGVTGVHQIRSRKMGPEVFLDLHIQVSPFISVSEGHHIAHQASQVLKTLPDIHDVTIHIDAEDDSQHPTASLPSRMQVIQKLNACQKEKTLHITTDNIQLHYLNDRINVDLFLNQHFLADADEQALRQCMQTEGWVGTVSFWYSRQITDDQK